MVTADLNKYSLKTMPRPSAVYNISEATTAYLPQLIKLQKESGIKEFAIAILNGVKCFNAKELTREQLTQALKSHKTRKTESSPLKPLSTANSMISRRIKELESLGCVKVRSEYRKVGENRRKYTVHDFLSFEGLIQHLEQSAALSPAPQGRPKNNDLVVFSEILESGGLIKLDADSKVIPYAEGAFSILESAARSKYDTDEVTHCRYYIRKDDYLEVTAATSTKEGSGIMFSSDQRVIQALNGMLRRAYYEIQPDLYGDDYPVKFVDEYCFFYLPALTKEIGLHANIKENRDNVLKMIERLKDTTYSVDATQSSYWRERYMPNAGFNKADYRYITEFYSAAEWVTEHGKGSLDHHFLEDRYFVIKFHPLIFKAMTAPKLSFISHDSLKSERLDIVHRLNNWVKPVVGVRQRAVPKDHHQYTLDIFHQRVRPAARLDNFERQFLALAKRQNGEDIASAHEETERLVFGEKNEIVEGGVFWLNGYYYRVEKNEELAQEIYRKTRTIRKRRKKIYPVITIWRDRKDSIVGDESDHNKALRRQLIELEKQSESVGSIDVSWNRGPSGLSGSAKSSSYDNEIINFDELALPS